MQESTSGSSVLNGGELPSWALFLVPVAVSVLVIVGTSAVVLSADPDPVDRNPPPSFDRQAHASIGDPKEPPPYEAAQERQPAARSASPPRASASRRRGFSPVLGDENEGASRVPPPAASAESGGEDDVYDDMSDADEPRKPITPERRQEIVQEMTSREDAIPFMRGFSRVVERVRSRRAGEAAPGNDVAGDDSGAQNPSEEPPLQQGFAGSGNVR